MKARYGVLFRLLSGFLILTFAGRDLAYAAPELRRAQVLAKDQAYDPGFTFSPSIAEIEHSFKAPGTSRVLYLLQDAHTNPSGQFNLAKALDRILTEEKGLRYVFSEGGVEDNSLSFLRSARPLAERQAMASRFVREGILHGASYLDLTSDRDFVLWGVEDPGLYNEALDRYADVVRGRERLKDHLNRISRALAALRDSVLSPGLSEVLDSIESFRREETPLTEHFLDLVSHARRVGLSLESRPSLKALKALQESESAIDFEAANREQKAALASLEPESRRMLEDLAGKHSASKAASEDTSADRAFSELLKERLGERLSAYPQLSAYYDYLKAASMIRARGILDELSTLQQDTLAAYIRTEDEALFVKVVRMSGLLEKMSRFTVTPDEYAEYRDLSGVLSYEQLAGFVNRKIMESKSHYDKALLLDADGARLIGEAGRFYELTFERDRVILDRALEKMDLEGQTKAVLICGGYHGVNLRSLLKERGVSFVSVVPQILYPTNMSRYEEILVGTGSSPRPFQASAALRSQAMPRLPLSPELNGTDRLPEAIRSIAGNQAAEFDAVYGARLAQRVRPVVFGAAGFIGQNLVEYLSARGEVPDASVKNINRRIIPQPGSQVIIGELPDAATIDRIAKSSDVIYHLAAVSTPAQAKTPEGTLASLATALGTARLVKAAGSKRIVRSSTELIYSAGMDLGSSETPTETTQLPRFAKGTPAGDWLDQARQQLLARVENKPGASLDSDKKFLSSFLSDNPIPDEMKDKVYALVYALDESFIAASKNGINVRLSQVYGPGDFYSEARLSKLIRYFLGHDQTMYPLWKGEKRRFIYVHDAVRILHGLSLLKELPADRVVNVGSPEEFTNEEVVSILKDLTDKDLELTYNERPLSILPQSPSRLQSLIPMMRLPGFRWTSLEEGLSETEMWDRSQGIRPFTYDMARESISDKEAQSLIRDLEDDVNGIVPAQAIASAGHKKDDLPKADPRRKPTVVITGGAGFMASNIARYFLKAHPTYQIVILDDLTYAGPKENLVDMLGSERFKDRVSVYRGDINNENLVKVLMRGTDLWIHMAAESNVDLAADPAMRDVVWRTNVEGTRILAMAADHENRRRSKLNMKDGKNRALIRFIHGSTDEVTGDSAQSQEHAFTEKSPYRPTNYYAESKVAAEKEILRINAASDSKLNAIIVRFTNNIGPAGTAKTLGPNVMIHLMAGLPVPLFMREKGRIVERERDFLSVFDTARAIDVLAHRGRPGEIYNVPGKERRRLTEFVMSVINHAKRAVWRNMSVETAEKEGLIEFLENNRPHNDASYVYDGAKFDSEFPDFERVITHDAAIRGMVSWYQRHPETVLESIRNEEYEAYYRRLYKDYPERADLLKKRIEQMVAETDRERSLPQGARLASAPNATWAARRTPTVANEYTIVSRQMEMGLHYRLLDLVAAKFGKPIARFVSQITLTGGLGALMHDLVEAWKWNGLDVISINPVFEHIKAQRFVKDADRAEKSRSFGTYLREALSALGARSKDEGLTDIEFKMQLPMSDEFKSKTSFGRKIQRGLEVKVYMHRGPFSGAPNYDLDILFTEDDGKKYSIFGEVYADDKLWRDVQIGAYSLASQMLVKELQARGLVRQNLIFVDNEAFVSLPTPMFPDAIHHHMNHTVYAPGLYYPDAASFELLGYPEYLRPYIVRDGRISMINAAAFFSDIVTGVSVYEHTMVLAKVFFTSFIDKLRSSYKGGLRNTNGALIEQWQGPEMSVLIAQYKALVGLAEDAADAELFDVLRRPEHSFKERIMLVKGAYVLEGLLWLRDNHMEAMWLDEDMKEYAKETGENADDPAGLLDRYQNAIRRAVNDPSGWAQVKEEFGSLADVLLRRPIASNVRRQVSYKGPDKWEELLNRLASDPAALEDFKKNTGRVILGGRIFGDNEGLQFARIQSLIRNLGLQNHVIAMENYNFFDAPTIFRMVSATVMLADEFLEASATSPAKGLMSGGVLIGVFGGFMPELFRIEESATGRLIDIFNEAGHRVTYDELEQHLKDASWRTVNGFVIQYSSEKSTEPGGGRRPSSESLFEALKALKRAFGSAEGREDLQFEALATTPLVDIQRSQARAHAMLWEETIRRRADQERLFRSEPLDLATMKQLLALQDSFEWHRRGDAQPIERGQAGVLGFVESARQLRAQGRQAYQSVAFHAYNRSGGDRGDIFHFIQDVLLRPDLGPGLQPLRSRIEALAIEATSAGETSEKVRLNLEAVALLDDFTRHLVREVFAAYLENPGAFESDAGWRMILRGDLFQRALMEHLDMNGRALNAATSKVKFFAVTRGDDHWVVAVDRGEFEYPDKGSGVVRARFYPQASVIFGTDLKGIYEVTDPSSDVPVDVENADKEGILMQVPKAIGLKALRFSSQDQPQTASLTAEGEADARALILTSLKGEYLSGAQHPASVIMDKMREAASLGTIREQRAALKGWLKPFLEMSAEDRRTAFADPSAAAAVMGLVAFLDPASFERMRTWNEEAYSRIKEMLTRDSQRLERVVTRGKIETIRSSRQGVISLVKSFEGERVMFVAHLAKGSAHTDGKYWATLYPAFSEISGRTLSVKDWFFGKPYAAVHDGTTVLSSGFDIGIPMEQGRLDPVLEKSQPGWRFQFLSFVDAPKGARLASEDKNRYVVDWQIPTQAEMRAAESRDAAVSTPDIEAFLSAVVETQKPFGSDARPNAVDEIEIPVRFSSENTSVFTVRIDNASEDGGRILRASLSRSSLESFAFPDMILTARDVTFHSDGVTAQVKASDAQNMMNRLRRQLLSSLEGTLNLRTDRALLYHMPVGALGDIVRDATLLDLYLVQAASFTKQSYGKNVKHTFDANGKMDEDRMWAVVDARVKRLSGLYPNLAPMLSSMLERRSSLEGHRDVHLVTPGRIATEAGRVYLAIERPEPGDIVLFPFLLAAVAGRAERGALDEGFFSAVETSLGSPIDKIEYEKMLFGEATPDQMQKWTEKYKLPKVLRLALDQFVQGARLVMQATGRSA